MFLLICLLPAAVPVGRVGGPGHVEAGGAREDAGLGERRGQPLVVVPEHEAALAQPHVAVLEAALAPPAAAGVLAAVDGGCRLEAIV